MLQWVWTRVSGTQSSIDPQGFFYSSHSSRITLRVFEYSVLSAELILYFGHRTEIRELTFIALALQLIKRNILFLTTGSLEINPLIRLLLRLRHLRESTTVKRLRMRQIRTSGRIGFPYINVNKDTQHLPVSIYFALK